MSLTYVGSVEEASEALASQGYLADRPLALSVYLASTLEQPLLLEGEAGVGKTEVARALASATGARLIRLQCHEGIDLHHAVYDWDYSRQLLALRATAAEEALRGQELTAENIAKAAEQAAEGTHPPTDLNASAEYKHHLARVLTRRAIQDAVGAG